VRSAAQRALEAMWLAPLLAAALGSPSCETFNGDCTGHKTCCADYMHHEDVADGGANGQHHLTCMRQDSDPRVHRCRRQFDVHNCQSDNEFSCLGCKTKSYTESCYESLCCENPMHGCMQRLKPNSNKPRLYALCRPFAECRKHGTKQLNRTTTTPTGAVFLCPGHWQKPFGFTNRAAILAQHNKMSPKSGGAGTVFLFCLVVVCVAGATFLALRRFKTVPVVKTALKTAHRRFKTVRTAEELEVVAEELEVVAEGDAKEDDEGAKDEKKGGGGADEGEAPTAKVSKKEAKQAKKEAKRANPEEKGSLKQDMDL